MFSAFKELCSEKEKTQLIIMNLVVICMNSLLINKYSKFREQYMKYSNESDISENPDS